MTKVFGSGDLRVNVNGASWTFNPLCLMPAPGETPPDVPGIFVLLIFKLYECVFPVCACMRV